MKQLSPPRFRAAWPRAILLLLLLAGPPPLAQAQTASTMELHNKQLIQQAFTRWADGTGNFFDLLAEDMRWTITGSAPLSKTYTSKQRFLDEVIAPLNQRLAKKITPTVRGLYAEGDMVIALWEGTATAKDGQPYNVTYSWHMRLAGDKIVEVTAFLDTLGFADIFQRIPAEH